MLVKVIRLNDFKYKSINKKVKIIINKHKTTTCIHIRKLSIQNKTLWALKNTVLHVKIK